MKSWTVHRRYKEFDTLNNKLVDLVSKLSECDKDEGGHGHQINLPKLPAKKMWASTDRSVVMERRVKLQAYIQTVLSLGPVKRGMWTGSVGPITTTSATSAGGTSGAGDSPDSIAATMVGSVIEFLDHDDERDLGTLGIQVKCSYLEARVSQLVHVCKELEQSRELTEQVRRYCECHCTRGRGARCPERAGLSGTLTAPAPHYSPPSLA